jgi:hypothetical protein
MEVTRALIELSKTACSRFGTPSATKEAVRSLINAPNKAELLAKQIDLPPDARWERLASAIIPPETDGFPIATLRTTSRAALEVLKESVASLAKDLRELQLKPIADRTAMALKDVVESVRGMATETPEFREENAQAARQLKIYHAVGPEWARVTPLEHLFLSWCSAPEDAATPPKCPPTEKRPLDRSDRSSQPDTALLQPFDLTWVWSDKRSAWEPASISSKFKNSSLFDLASHFFTARLEDERHPLGARAAELYESLRDARKTYEQTRHDDEVSAVRTLRRQQRSILQDYIGVSEL